MWWAETGGRVKWFDALLSFRLCKSYDHASNRIRAFSFQSLLSAHFALAITSVASRNFLRSASCYAEFFKTDDDFVVQLHRAYVDSLNYRLGLWYEDGWTLPRIVTSCIFSATYLLLQVVVVDFFCISAVVLAGFVLYGIPQGLRWTQEFVVCSTTLVFDNDMRGNGTLTYMLFKHFEHCCDQGPDS